jgi:hypothetical protein
MLSQRGELGIEREKFSNTYSATLYFFLGPFPFEKGG